MSLRFLEGYDMYGTDETEMLDGNWASVGGTLVTSSPTPRTGTGAMKFFANRHNRKVLPVAGDVQMGMCGIYLMELPSDSTCMPICYLDGNSFPQCAVKITPTGALQGYIGYNSVLGPSSTGATIGSASSPVLVAASWQHMEWEIKIHDSAGYIKVWVDGLLVLNETGHDTKGTSSANAEQFFHGRDSSAVGDPDMTIDDLCLYDDAGAIYNVAPIGIRKVYTCFVNGDTAQTDWIRNGGASDFGRLNENPSDEATSYVYGAPGDISDYDCEDLPVGVTTVDGVMPQVKARKSDSGTAFLQTGVVSAGVDELGDTVAPGTSFTYYQPNVFERDPNGDIAWTRTSFNASYLRLDRPA